MEPIGPMQIQTNDDFLNHTDFPTLGFDVPEKTKTYEPEQKQRKKQRWVKETFQKKEKETLKKEERTWDMSKIQKNQNLIQTVPDIPKTQPVEPSISEIHTILQSKEKTNTNTNSNTSTKTDTRAHSIQTQNEALTEGPWIVHHTKLRKSRQSTSSN